MACGRGFDDCRREHIAARLRDVTPKGTDWEARCPVCGHESFRVSRPKETRYRNIWGCACRGRCRCNDAAALRAALLRLDIPAACLGSYGGSAKASTDPNMAARLETTARDILAVPGLKPSEMRIALAEALGEKVPEDFGTFIKWAMSLGISRSEAYRIAPKYCRPADSSSSPEGGVVDT